MGFENIQRELAKIILGSLAEDGFALAGSGAIREHGLINRPTQDLDLFVKNIDPTAFDRSIEKLGRCLARNGYSLIPVRRAPLFFQGYVTKEGTSMELDLGCDYRSYPPSILDVGPVLDLKDAVANKVCAVFSRGEPRDFLDLDAIRLSGRFTDDELIQLASDNDPGFTPELLAESISSMNLISPEEVAPYGYSAQDFENIKSRLLEWANRIR